MFDRKVNWKNSYQEKSALDISWYQKESALSLELTRGAQIFNVRKTLNIFL